MLFCGSEPGFLFAAVNMPQCYEGMGGWVSFAGWAQEVVISNRELNKELIRVTYYWLPNGEKGMHWFKACFQDADSGVTLWGEMLAFLLISLSSPPFAVRVWWNLWGPLQLGLGELGTKGVSSTLKSVSCIKVSTITCYGVLYWSQIPPFLQCVHCEKWVIFIFRVFGNSKWD